MLLFKLDNLTADKTLYQIRYCWYRLIFFNNTVNLQTQYLGLIKIK